MNIEIERKFLVNKLFKAQNVSIHIKQYYISIDEKIVQRLRIFNHEKAIVSFKEKSSGLSRYEFEYEIPLKDAKKMIGIMNPIFIEKMRHILHYDSMKWEVDQFLDKNEGLIIAEIELKSETQNFKLPDWIDVEVSDQKKYYNYNLALEPYISWK